MSTQWWIESETMSWERCLRVAHLLTKVHENKLRWFELMKRKTAYAPIRMMENIIVEGNQSQNRLKKTWEEQIKLTCESFTTVKTWPNIIWWKAFKLLIIFDYFSFPYIVMSLYLVINLLFFLSLIYFFYNSSVTILICVVSCLCHFSRIVCYSLISFERRGVYISLKYHKSSLGECLWCVLV